MNPTTAYIPVSVETPPISSGWFFVQCHSDNSDVSKAYENSAYYDNLHNKWSSQGLGVVTHWLQPVERYVLTD